MGRAVSFSTREIAKVTIASGRLGASDPLITPNPRPFTRPVPIGEYPVELALASFVDDERVAYARVRFGDAPPVSWEMAIGAGDDVSTLGADDFIGYAVDAGTGCFMDHAAGIDLDRRMDAETDYYETIVD